MLNLGPWDKIIAFSHTSAIFPYWNNAPMIDTFTQIMKEVRQGFNNIGR